MNTQYVQRLGEWFTLHTKQITHLVLYEKLNSLNGSSSSLGDPGSNSGEHKVLSKSQLLVRHLGGLVVARQRKVPEGLFPELRSVLLFMARCRTGKKIYSSHVK